LNDTDRLEPGSGKSTWGIVGGEKSPIVWTIDPVGGVIQGPLDLCSLAGRCLHLVLRQGQIALMSASGGRRVFFQHGSHLARVGDGGLPADGLLYFMHTDRTFEIPWEQVIPVPRSELGDASTRLASGSFEVRIESPIRFHAEMLRDRAGEGEAICRNTLARVMPTLLTIRLVHACGREANTARQREILASLRAEDLNPDLVSYGLSCVSLRVDGAFLEQQPPVPVP
jgi:hypothetical protein